MTTNPFWVWALHCACSGPYPAGAPAAHQRAGSWVEPVWPLRLRRSTGAPAYLIGQAQRMKHAGPEALEQLETLLTALRGLPELREKSRGTFYRGSRAFLHFHEDPTGLFADVRIDSDFERLRVNDAREQKQLLRRVRDAL